MTKMALLIGVSEYEPGLTPLPGAIKDVEAMQRVLQDGDIGSFDEVKTLANPDSQLMKESIETLFLGRAKEDLVVLFFSGHGVKDESGRLHLATRITRKTPQGELIRATAVPANFIQEIMSNSRSKRQVVILDCCFSGAFAEGWSAKDDGAVDVKTQLGGEGRAVLTSSTSTQYSFEQEGFDLSTYTRYLVEGIETGAADRDRDGVVSIDELHDYAKEKVQEAAPAMKPEIYAVKEGYRINLAQAPTDDPKLKYRKEVEQCISHGAISNVGRTTLDVLREELGLLPEEAVSIEAQVLKPYQEYQRKLQQYEQALEKAIQHEHPLSHNTQHELRRLQQVLKLRDEDIAKINVKNISEEDESVKISQPEIPAGEQGEVSVKPVAPIGAASRVKSPISRIRALKGLPVPFAILKNPIAAGLILFLTGLVFLQLQMGQKAENPDPLGTVWTMEVSGWQGVWRRREKTDEFDAIWTKPSSSLTSSIKVKRNGNFVEVEETATGRSSSLYACTYQGMFDQNTRTISGSGQCTGSFFGEFPWNATIK